MGAAAGQLSARKKRLCEKSRDSPDTDAMRSARFWSPLTRALSPCRWKMLFAIRIPRALAAMATSADLVAKVAAEPENLSFLKGAFPAFDAVAVIDAQVVTVGAIEVVAEDLAEAAGVVRADVVLDDHVAAVEVDVAARGIARALGVCEVVVFDENIGARPRPQSAAASPLPAVRGVTGMIDAIAAKQAAGDA